MELRPPDRDRPALRLDGPRIMGILNVTPDSFSDGGRYGGAVEAAVAAGLSMAREGAAILDVGGESTRPGAQRIEAEEQIRRTAPVIRALRDRLDAEGYPGVLISIDTTLSAVAAATLDAGASIVNDVASGREDEALLPLVAQRRCPVVLMHMQGEPGTMQQAPRYADVVAEVHEFLMERLRAAEAAGVPASQVVLDPGIGFGKTTEHNLQLLAGIDTLVATGQPVLVGASRKRFLGALAAGSGDEAAGPADRLGGTCAVTALMVAAGVHLVRVHDVAANVQAAAVARAVGDRTKFGK